MCFFVAFFCTCLAALISPGAYTGVTVAIRVGCTHIDVVPKEMPLRGSVPEAQNAFMLATLWVGLRADIDEIMDM